MGATREPVPFEVYKPGVYLHGTKADIAVGEVLSLLRVRAAGGSTSSSLQVHSRTTPTSRTSGSPGIRRSHSAVATRCASWVSLSTGSATHRRSCRLCRTDSLR